MKKVLIISASLRYGSNSEILAEVFKKGAEDNENEVEYISLKDKKIDYCRGCMACSKKDSCIIDDDASAIIEKMQEAEVLVLASPIYFYGLAGQLKTLLDRSNPLYGKDYHFRDVYLLTSSAEDEENTNAKAINMLEGWLECFDKAKLVKAVNAGGLDEPSAIKGNEILSDVYMMAKEIY